MQNAETKTHQFKDARIEQIQALLVHMENGDEKEVDKILDELTRLRESMLFQELGKLTRKLHEALNAFRCDERLVSLAKVEIPDAKERLSYVIDMTEQAASRTLGVVEASRPVCNELVQRAGTLNQDLTRFLRREMEVQDFRDFCRRLGQFLSWAGQQGERLGKGLSDVLMAQDFQDLTGQIIRRVITLVEEFEANLVDLIRISGHKLSPSGNNAAPKKNGELDGPRVPGLNDEEMVSGQDEVDELLSSLGF